MKYILCYGDSNTWGWDPRNGRRYDFHNRWPGILQKELGDGYHIYENALNGRTTVFDDPIEEGRCGKTGFPVVLESCAPLDLVIIMLGTNDCKNRFALDPWDIGWGMDLLIQYVQRSKSGRSLKSPPILVAAPPALGNQWDKTIMGTVFSDASTQRCQQLPAIYREIVSKHRGVYFFDASALVSASQLDSVHLTVESHGILGSAFGEQVTKILSES